MRIAVFLSAGDDLSRRAAGRASRAIFLAACVLAAGCALAAALILNDARNVIHRNEFLAKQVAKLEAESREAEGNPEWKALREKGGSFSAGLHARGPGVVETLGLLESAIPEGVVLRGVQIFRSGTLQVEGVSKTLAGGERFRKRLAETGSRWVLSQEHTGYDQSRGVYGFRMKGAWGSHR